MLIQMKWGKNNSTKIWGIGLGIDIEAYKCKGACHFCYVFILSKLNSFSKQPKHSDREVTVLLKTWVDAKGAFLELFLPRLDLT